MEPILPNPNMGNQALETNPGASLETPEQVAVNPEQASRPPALSSAQPVSSDQPVADSAVPTQVNSTAPVTDGADVPAVADDVDVIEKEWVDRAKKIVNSTKNDPHAQEKEVSKLQADYLMKRYGKQMKTTE